MKLLRIYAWEEGMSEEENVQDEAKTVEFRLGDLVVVGSSAGGIEALSVLVGSLPADFPAPIVLAQHLDPSRPSNLNSILRRRTSLPVELVLSSSQLEKGKIYVVPSNRMVSILDGHVEVQEDALKRNRPRPSVDLLLSSAAAVYGDRLIAVILTGSGSDGAVGAVDVKNAGGTVIVQDPQTARYPSMPLALPPTVVDFEVDVAGDLAIFVANGQPPAAQSRPFARLDHGRVNVRGRLVAGDIHHLQTFELLALGTGPRGRAGPSLVLGDELFELLALGERGGVRAQVVLQPLLLIFQKVVDLAGEHGQLAPR